MPVDLGCAACDELDAVVMVDARQGEGEFVPAGGGRSFGGGLDL